MAVTLTDDAITALNEKAARGKEAAAFEAARIAAETARTARLQPFEQPIRAAADALDAGLQVVYAGSAWRTASSEVMRHHRALTDAIRSARPVEVIAALESDLQTAIVARDALIRGVLEAYELAVAPHRQALEDEAAAIDSERGIPRRKG